MAALHWRLGVHPYGAWPGCECENWALPIAADVAGWHCPAHGGYVVRISPVRGVLYRVCGVSGCREFERSPEVGWGYRGGITPGQRAAAVDERPTMLFPTVIPPWSSSLMGWGWAVAFVAAMLVWALVLDATVGLENLRRLLGWTF